MDAVRLDIIGWLLVPLTVAVIAAIWAVWRSRPRGPVDPSDSIAERERFRQAMDRNRGDVDPPGTDQA